MVEDFSDCLFDRDLDDDDYLDIRIGYGNKKAVKEINILVEQLFWFSH